jgi:hypothetical protein
LLPLSGCESRKINSLSAELSQSKAQLKELEASQRQLEWQCSQLQDRLAALQSEHEELKRIHLELSQWARQLAQQYGPGLWYLGTEERPLPRKSLPGATASRLAQELNRLFKSSGLPHFTLRNIQGDTAYVRVDGERQLTQEMGTTGATAYLQAVTYTLTSLPGIQYVDFEFQAGDHAMPGKYSR